MENLTPRAKILAHKYKMLQSSGLMNKQKKAEELAAEMVLIMGSMIIQIEELKALSNE